MDRITDRPDMTSAFYHGRKASTQTKQKHVHNGCHMKTFGNFTSKAFPVVRSFYIKMICLFVGCFCCCSLLFVGFGPFLLSCVSFFKFAGIDFHVQPVCLIREGISINVAFFRSNPFLHSLIHLDV